MDIDYYQDGFDDRCLERRMKIYSRLLPTDMFAKTFGRRQQISPLSRCIPNAKVGHLDFLNC